MRPVLVLSASAAALFAAGCDQVTSRAVTRLTCPQTEGVLSRVSEAADGQSCVYRSRDGADLTLRLIPVKGDVRSTLDGIEAELRTSFAGSADAPATTGEAKAEAASNETAAAAERVRAEAEADAGGDSEDREPSWNVDDRHGRRSGDEKAEVDLPGIHIRSDGDDARVQVGPLRINSRSGETVIRTLKDVRMRGEALSREKRGMRGYFLLIRARGDWVAYEASGLRTGPITVALVRGPAGDHDRLSHDTKRLVRSNGGA